MIATRIEFAPTETRSVRSDAGGLGAPGRHPRLSAQSTSTKEQHAKSKELEETIEEGSAEKREGEKTG